MDDTSPVMLLQILSPEGVVLDEYEACGVHPSVVDLLASQQASLHVVIGEKTMTTNTAAPTAPTAPAATAPVAPTVAPNNLLTALGLDQAQLGAVMSALGTGMGASLAPMVGDAVKESLKTGLESLKPMVKEQAKEAMKEILAEEAKRKEEETDWIGMTFLGLGAVGLCTAGYAAYTASRTVTLLEDLTSKAEAPALPGITM